MSRARATMLVIAGVLGACARAHVEAAPQETVRTTAAELRAPRPPAGVSVELRTPARARWLSSTLGPAKPTIHVVVTNRDDVSSADVSDLRVHLEAMRDGVFFRCAASVGAPDGVREPSSLGPRANFVFDRTLDCSLPLTGSYTVGVSVSFGHGQWQTPHVVHAFALRVEAPEAVEPKPVAGVRGLWAAVGASELLFGGKAEDGSGRIAVALVNGGTKSVRIPRLRLGLRVYRAGSPFPCEDAPIDLRSPRELDPGETHHEPIDVSCLGLGSPGKYEVAARLRVGRMVDAPEVDLGRLRIEVAADPTHRTFLLPEEPSLAPKKK